MKAASSKPVTSGRWTVLEAALSFALCATTPPVAIAQIGSQTISSGGTSGTAFAVSGSGKLLTNNHVVSNCNAVEIQSSAQTGIARVVARDSRNDLALLETDLPTRQFASFRKTDGRSGEDVIAVGYPLRGLLASDINVSVGIVSAMAGIRNDTSQLQVSAAVQPGNSGGPLLDQSGTVIGVVVAKLDALAVAKVIGDIPQNINFAIKGDVAQTFLKTHGVEPRVAPDSTKRQQTVDIASAARAFTFLVLCDPTQEAKLRTPAERQEEQRRLQAKAEEDRRALEREQAERAERERTDAQLAANFKLGLPLPCGVELSCQVAKYFDHGSGVDFRCGKQAQSGEREVSFYLPYERSESPIPVLAAAPGTVDAINRDKLFLKHPGGWETSYTIIVGSVTKNVGDRVSEGEEIARTGGGAKEFFAFRVRRDGEPVDPFVGPEFALTCPNSQIKSSLWKPDAVLPPYPEGPRVLEAGFVPTEAFTTGNFRQPITAESPWITFVVVTTGYRVGDNASYTLAGPRGNVISKVEGQITRDHVVSRSVFTRKKLLGNWDPGTYKAQVRVVRNSAVVLDFIKEIEIK